MTEIEILPIITIICALISIICSIFILIKDKNELLNQLLFLTFGSWAVNIFCLSFIYSMSFDQSFLNLIRDIDISFGIVSAFFLFLAGITLKYGKERTKKPNTILISAIIALSLIIIAIPNDRVDLAEEDIISETLGVFAIFLIPGFIALIGVGFFFQVYQNIPVDEFLLRRRILFFILGSFCLILGAVILGLRNLFSFMLDLSTLRIIANLIYTLGPILVLWSFYGVQGKQQVKFND